MSTGMYVVVYIIDLDESSMLPLAGRATSVIYFLRDELAEMGWCYKGLCPTTSRVHRQKVVLLVDARVEIAGREGASS